MSTRSLFSLPASLSLAARRRRRHALARLAVAWLAMMQVMMLAWPGYLRHSGMGVQVLETLDAAIVLMNWASLALTVPVMLYSAWPIWRGAAASLRRGRVGMEVPVALGMLAAFAPSAVATWAGHGPVYFDSATMFAAFLLTARYLALCARQSAQAGSAQAWIEARRAPLGGWADRFAGRFTAVQLGLALGAAVVWETGGGAGDTLSVVVAMLVISCPCAMAMAVPTALAAAHAAVIARPDMPGAEVRTLAAAMERTARACLYGSLAWHLLLTPLAALGWVAPQVAAITMLASSLAVASAAWALHRRAVRGGAPLAPAPTVPSAGA